MVDILEMNKSSRVALLLEPIPNFSRNARRTFPERGQIDAHTGTLWESQFNAEKQVKTACYQDLFPEIWLSRF